MFSIQTILHPTDFSEASGYALSLACALASDYDAGLVIVHVVAAPVVLSEGVLYPHPEQGQAGLGDKLDHLDVSDDRIGVVRRLGEGRPATEILRLARLCDADLIVMGSHRRQGLSRWFLGSVAEAVMRTATCPVLIATRPVGRPDPSGHVNHWQAAQH
jgi:nucleotide-binding universal stress UspA family protein